ncbi:MAG: CBS domain-containing protein [Candidatus Omnitrophota bacterium]
MSPTLIAKDLMTKKVTTVSPEVSIKDAALKLFKMGVSSLPVVDGENHVIGIISEGDLIKMALPSYALEAGRLSFLPEYEPFERKLANADKVKIKEIMREAMTIEEDEPIIEVARLMVIKQVRSIPVVKDAKLTGMISRCDVLKEMVRRSGILGETK